MKKLRILLVLMFMLTGCQKSILSPEEQNKIVSRKLITQGVVAMNNKDPKGAILDLEGAIKDDPSQKEAYLLLGQVYLRLGSPGDAAQVLGYAAHFFPDDGTVFYMLAIAENSAGQKTIALGACRHSAEIFSQDQQEEVYKNAMVMAIVLCRDISQ